MITDLVNILTYTHHRGQPMTKHVSFNTVTRTFGRGEGVPPPSVGLVYVGATDQDGWIAAPESGRNPVPGAYVEAITDKSGLYKHVHSESVNWYEITKYRLKTPTGELMFPPATPFTDMIAPAPLPDWRARDLYAAMYKEHTADFDALPPLGIERMENGASYIDQALQTQRNETVAECIAVLHKLRSDRPHIIVIAPDCIEALEALIKPPETDAQRLERIRDHVTNGSPYPLEPGDKDWIFDLAQQAIRKDQG